MLRLGKTYRIFKGKKTTGGGHTMLSISESTRDQQTGEWKNEGWWSICVEGEYPCERGDNYKFTLEKITGISQREYNGKNYVTVFAEGQMDTGNGRSNPDGFEPVANTEELPF